MANSENPQSEPIRLAPGRKPESQRVLVVTLAALSGGMLFFAVPSLIGGSGIGAWIKALFLALAATTVAYGVNKLAIERGAPLATKGYKIAGIASVLSILAVGTGLSLGTFPGLVLKSVAQIRLDAYGAALYQFVSASLDGTAQSTRILPTINAVVADLTAKRDCEVRSSCISGAGGGGRGPVARVIEERLGRAEAIAAQVDAGGAARTDIAKRVEGLLGRYQEILADDKSVDEKWPLLRAVDGQIKKAVGEASEAMPQTLVAAYARELGANVDIPGRPDVSRQVASILQTQAATLRGVTGSIGRVSITPPSFPSQPGVSDTLSYIGHFAPIAAIVVVVELIIPMLVWIYHFLTWHWGTYVLEKPEKARRHEEDEVVADLLARPKRVAEPAADAAAKPRVRKPKDDEARSVTKPRTKRQPKPDAPETTPDMPEPNKPRVPRSTPRTNGHDNAEL